MASPNPKNENSAFSIGSRVLARVHPLELDRGVFIVGHRLEPLCGPDFFPWDVSIEDENGKLIPKRTIAFPLKNAMLFYSLFGAPMFFTFLMAQDDKNGENISSTSEDSIVRLVAFDLKERYSAWGLSAGDYLELELQDPAGRSFKARPVKAADIEPNLHTAWLGAMDAAVKTAMHKLKSPVPPETLIREAFLAAPKELLGKPAAAFSEYYNESGALQIRDVGASSVMWKHGADIPALVIEASSHPRKGADALEKSLARCNLGVDKAEIAAFVKDAIHRGRPASEGIERCFEGVRELGLPKADVSKLFSQSFAFAEEIAQTYDKSNESTNIPRLRSALLDIYADFLLWMRGLESVVQDPKDLETQDFTMLSQMMSQVCDLIGLLEEENPPTAKEIKPLKDALPSLCEAARSLMEDIRSELVEGSGDPRREGASSRPSSFKNFIIVVSIADIEPPIVRMLSIPGNRSLGELHDILQDAFGWSDSHLHHFAIKGIKYGQPSPDDFEVLEDESEVRLDELGLRGQSRFEYVYDYGDDWRHEIVVRMSKKGDPAYPDRPVCISASRNAPPEDCGGSPGYLALIAALATPAKKRSPEDKELLAWADGWDPKACDMQAINELLADD